MATTTINKTMTSNPIRNARLFSDREIISIGKAPAKDFPRRLNLVAFATLTKAGRATMAGLEVIYIGSSSISSSTSSRANMISINKANRHHHYRKGAKSFAKDHQGAFTGRPLTKDSSNHHCAETKIFARVSKGVQRSAAATIALAKNHIPREREALHQREQDERNYNSQ